MSEIWEGFIGRIAGVLLLYTNGVSMSLVLLSMLACSPSQTSDSVAEADDTSTQDSSGDDTGDDTGDTQDTAVTPEDCLKYHGIMGAGGTWNYRWHNSQRTGGRLVTVFEYDNDQNTATLKTQDSWSQSGASYTGTRYEYFVCDGEYLYKLQDINDYTSVTAGNSSTGHSETVYDEPYLLRPNQPTIGQTWSSRAVGTSIGSDGVPQSFDETTMWGVMEEGIGVSGGFTAMKIGAPSGVYYYWEEGVGMIYFASIAWLDSHNP